MPATNVVIGHGRADDWESLAAFLEDELRCKVVEFNSDPTAGLFTGERILDMLDRSKFAFLDAFPEVVRTLVREGLVDTVISERVLRKLK